MGVGGGRGVPEKGTPMLGTTMTAALQKRVAASWGPWAGRTCPLSEAAELECLPQRRSPAEAHSMKTLGRGLPCLPPPAISDEGTCHLPSAGLGFCASC